MLLDRSRGALVCCVPIDRSAWRRCTSNKSVVFGAVATALVSEPKHVTEDLALYWLSSLFKKATGS